jgi:hypothetical protein
LCLFYAPLCSRGYSVSPVKLFFCNFSKTYPFITTRSEEAPFRSSTVLHVDVIMYCLILSHVLGLWSQLRTPSCLTPLTTCYSAAYTRATGATHRQRRGEIYSIHVSHHHLLSVFTSLSVRGAFQYFYSHQWGSRRIY